ncbi:Uncharacterised protein [Lysinibacillus capsici]|uniref:Uncharacterized protein n=1 Tax=Lysinibacillus capsici TaxID=2115968 RepID=A0A2X1BQP5_9BACI|nr:Uncharacterised protein [Lysinibacillus capsici]
MLDSKYEEGVIVNGFPVPKNAEVIGEDELIDIESNISNSLYLDWPKVTNGIPFDYKLLIMLKGWKEVDSETFEDGDTLRVYTKDDAEIKLTTMESSIGILLSMPNKK